MNLMTGASVSGTDESAELSCPEPSGWLELAEPGAEEPEPSAADLGPQGGGEEQGEGSFHGKSSFLIYRTVSSPAGSMTVIVLPFRTMRPLSSRTEKAR